MGYVCSHLADSKLCRATEECPGVSVVDPCVLWFGRLTLVKRLNHLLYILEHGLHRGICLTASKMIIHFAF